ncbi:MAG: hypothetical protein AB7K78_23925 [Xanthobacteraceae bacterium]
MDSAARRQPQRKAGGCGGVCFACGGDLMQRAAAETAAERVVDCRNTERKRRRRAIQSQRGFDGMQLFAQPADERPIRYAQSRSFGCSHGLIRRRAAGGRQFSS